MVLGMMAPVVIQSDGRRAFGSGFRGAAPCKAYTKACSPANALQARKCGLYSRLGVVAAWQRLTIPKKVVQ
jgi:hypothetical protein